MRRYMCSIPITIPSASGGKKLVSIVSDLKSLDKLKLRDRKIRSILTKPHEVLESKEKDDLRSYFKEELAKKSGLEFFKSFLKINEDFVVEMVDLPALISYMGNLNTNKEGGGFSKEFLTSFIMRLCDMITNDKREVNQTKHDECFMDRLKYMIEVKCMTTLYDRELIRFLLEKRCVTYRMIRCVYYKEKGGWETVASRLGVSSFEEFKKLVDNCGLGYVFELGIENEGSSGVVDRKELHGKFRVPLNDSKGCEEDRWMKTGYSRCLSAKENQEDLLFFTTKIKSAVYGLGLNGTLSFREYSLCSILSILRSAYELNLSKEVEFIEKEYKSHIEKSLNAALFDHETIIQLIHLVLGHPKTAESYYEGLMGLVSRYLRYLMSMYSVEEDEVDLFGKSLDMIRDVVESVYTVHRSVGMRLRVGVGNRLSDVLAAVLLFEDVVKSPEEGGDLRAVWKANEDAFSVYEERVCKWSTFQLETYMGIFERMAEMNMCSRKLVLCYQKIMVLMVGNGRIEAKDYHKVIRNVASCNYSVEKMKTFIHQEVLMKVSEHLKAVRREPNSLSTTGLIQGADNPGILEVKSGQGSEEKTKMDHCVRCIDIMYYMAVNDIYLEDAMEPLLREVDISSVMKMVSLPETTTHVILLSYVVLMCRTRAAFINTEKFDPVMNSLVEVNQRFNETFAQSEFSEQVIQLMNKYYYDYMKKYEVAQIFHVHAIQETHVVLCVDESHCIGNTYLYNGMCSLSIKLLESLKYNVHVIQKKKFESLDKRNKRMEYIRDETKGMSINEKRMFEDHTRPAHNY